MKSKKDLIASMFRPFLTCLVVLLSISQLRCSKADEELSQAASVITWVIAPANLERSQFAAAFPDCKPSEFVNYFFSTMGASEMPPSEAEAEMDPIVRDQAESIRMPLSPANVAFVSRNPDLKMGKQLVLKFDDARGVVIAEGYIDPNEAPEFVREWKLEKVTPLPFVKEIFQSNVEMGMRYTSFE